MPGNITPLRPHSATDPELGQLLWRRVGVLERQRQRLLAACGEHRMTPEQKAVLDRQFALFDRLIKDLADKARSLTARPATGWFTDLLLDAQAVAYHAMETASYEGYLDAAVIAGDIQRDIGKA